MPTEPAPCRDVWCQSGQCWREQSRGSSPALLPQDWNTWQCPGLGPEPGEDSRCLHAVKANEAIRLLLLLENQTCKQSGRAFTFTRVFPVWSMPKCRTWKSAYGEGETCIYSIKSRPYGEIYDVNSSITVLMYLMWGDSAEPQPR